MSFWISFVLVPPWRKLKDKNDEKLIVSKIGKPINQEIVLIANLYCKKPDTDGYCVSPKQIFTLERLTTMVSILVGLATTIP